MQTTHVPNTEFWSNKRVLVTGHTGFKGGWLVLWLLRLGAKVSGISLPPQTQPSLFDLTYLAQQCDSHFADIRNPEELAKLVQAVRPEIIFHLAAQPLVRASYREPLATFSSNVMGTAHLLEALRFTPSTQVALMITTDKVYRNQEWAYPYREDDPLGGHDPYSSSKAASELVISCYRDSFLRAQGIAVASARAGNVIGGGDWSEDRLIPDAVRAWQSKKVLSIRSPQAIRPWQHVLEPLAGYLSLAEKLWQSPTLAGAYNFGPNSHETATVQAVIELARTNYGSGDVSYARFSDNLHEANCLALETSHTRCTLGITPRWNLAHAIQNTMSWYRQQSSGESAWSLCESQISDYEATSQ